MDSKVKGAPDEDADRVPLSERAYVALRDMIVTLRITPGSPIHEDRLSKTIGVGRTPMREAIKRLESEDLVAIYPRRGTFAADINITDHGLIAEVRRQLEAQGARSAADRATRRQREMLGALGERIGQQRDDETMMRLDTEIHRAIYHATGNRYLESSLNHYYNLALRIWYLFLPRLGGMATHLADHEALLQAIIGGDGDKAASAAAEHVAHFESAVFAALRS
ncbi:DNA-binding transcriptional regulator, GntR family [Amycolatopsis marina]|uniref:DNA-binding transcriptional regulator, GntR family n=1 Tax=Amycolatopsis marina TaxID=490629 RepID=A0A1I1AYL9_9PSEU|nr:GntR family transcriptional regulator [Amycolatopsis marina]SFB43164.1 DNA-binding transcriptional regulator, GntR family [Amycolatopsis marina]